MFQTIQKHVQQNVRISAEEALYLYEQAPLKELCELADSVRKQKFGNSVYYNRNIHFEPTNQCIYACKFCAFRRTPGNSQEQGAWDFSLEDLDNLLQKHPKGSITEIHITGGVHPERGIEYGEELCRYIHLTRPELHIKAFTAVEISYFAKKSNLSIRESLIRLKEAGLNSIPGGGAEIFDPEIRHKIAGKKAPAHTWLEVHREAHLLGLKSNATILYGHIEKFEHRIDHMNQLRTLQDETNGFLSFIPLRYRNENNALSNLAEVLPEDDLRNYAVSRLFLDNIPHIKAYWVMSGIDLALKALSCGVDDLDGTIDDTTKIYSMAGGKENPAQSSQSLRTMIEDQGLQAVERNSLYEVI